MSFKVRIVCVGLITTGVALGYFFCSCLSPSKKYEAERELVFYYPHMMESSTNMVDSWRIGATDALFHMRSALVSLARDKSRAKIVAGFMRQHVAYSSDERVVKKAFQGVTTEITCGSLPSLKSGLRPCRLENRQGEGM